jgi:hypothetical protein
MLDDGRPVFAALVSPESYAKLSLQISAPLPFLFRSLFPSISKLAFS